MKNQPTVPLAQQLDALLADDSLEEFGKLYREVETLKLTPRYEQARIKFEHTVKTTAPAPKD